MSEEIKEILEYYQKDIDKFEHSMKDYNEEQLKTTFEQSYQRYRNHKLLLDYITNLQEENERLNNIINEFEEWLEQEYAIVKSNSIEEPNNPEWYIKWNERKIVLDKIKELKGE